MKTDIHPEFHIDAKATCACGASFVVGSTMKDIHMEICSHCHPFYTGKEKILDTAGRVEKIQTAQSRRDSENERKKIKSVISTEVAPLFCALRKKSGATSFCFCVFSLYTIHYTCLTAGRLNTPMGINELKKIRKPHI